MYSFVGLNEDLSVNLMDLASDVGALNNLRQRSNNQVKIMLSIGGGNEGSTKFSRMASTAENRQRFVNRMIDLLQQYKFDGLDVDWEYPGQNGGASYDKV